ncbi:hypothetical protein FISHEDRAFT_9609, partial [Fistulina hepatica ATCC 64428]
IIWWILKTILIASPRGAPLLSAFVWIARLTAFSVLLRTHIAPWILTHLSRTIRARSISLRSIRGLYIHTGSRTIRIERLSYVYTWTPHQPFGNLTLKLDDFHIQVNKSLDTPFPPAAHTQRHLSVAYLSPGPVARQLRKLILRAALYVLRQVDPYVRPYVRATVIVLMRFILRVLSWMARSIALDIHTVLLTFEDLPSVCASTQLVHLQMGLHFEGFNRPIAPFQNNHSRSRSFYNITHNRVADSLRRSWDAAWRNIEGTATWSLKAQDVHGSIALDTGKGSTRWFEFPEDVTLDGTAEIHPNTRSLQNLSVALNIGRCNIDLDTVGDLIRDWKSIRPSSSSLAAEFTRPSSASVFTTPPESPNSTLSPAAASRSPLLQALTVVSTRSVEVTEVSFRKISVDGRRGDPALHLLHRTWLGKSSYLHNPPSFVLGFGVRQVSLDRRNVVDVQRLVDVGPLDISFLLSHWPSSISPVQHLCGDPNEPLVVVKMNFSGMQITEKLSRLPELFSFVPGSGLAPAAQPRTPSPDIVPLPRIAVEIDVGPLCLRVGTGSPTGHTPSVLEFRTDGFAATLQTHYVVRPQSHRIFHDDLYHLRFSVDGLLHPAYVRLRQSWPSSRPGGYMPLKATEKEYIEDPALLTLQGLELRGTGSGLADVRDDEQQCALVDLPSLICDMHISADTLCAEMWHPSVRRAVGALIAEISEMKNLTPSRPSKSSTDMPSGIVLTVALRLITGIVTAPDIKARDDPDANVGVALRSRVWAQYCCIRSRHLHHFQGSNGPMLNRQLLSLAPDCLPEAIQATGQNKPQVFLRAIVGDTTIRSAAATQYGPDTPLMEAGDDIFFRAREFLRVNRVRVDISLPHIVSVLLDDGSYNVSVEVPSVRGELDLAHLYSILLTARVLSSLKPPRKAYSAVRSEPPLRVTVVIQTTQLVLTLRKQRLVCRFDAITLRLLPRVPLNVTLDHLVVWVPSPRQVNKWEKADTSNKWQEFIVLRKWDVSLPSRPSFGSPSAIVDGVAMRMRIPNGYVLADLILDISLVFKATKHLANMVKAGRSSRMPNPGAEEAKNVPHLNVAVRFLSFEMADDPLESRLSLIWRTGLDGARHRTEREAAFEAKVAAIISYEDSGSKFVEDHLVPNISSDYEFNAEHTVSIEEARRRLDEVHTLDWFYRINALGERRRRSEESVLHKLPGHRTSTRKRHANTVPDLVAVEKIEGPPLLRLVLEDLRLSVGPPSFPIEKLPDFMYDHGGGMPRDTQYTLLIPMHLDFTISSLRASIRDYPMPLVYIPPHSDGTTAACEFNTDLVIAEEVGPQSTVEWIQCPVITNGVYGTIFSIAVHKTVMPVKTYAAPIIQVTTDNVTMFTWGVSYSPAIQDIMRIVDTLTTSPRDSSPGIGFWDKMKLLLHWRLKFLFKDEVRFHFKGSRDPQNILDDGAGFALVWQGNPKLLIGHHNDDDELVQVISDSMFIVIPKFVHFLSSRIVSHVNSLEIQSSKDDLNRKICAKFRSGVRFGVGFLLERTCGPECPTCTGSAFHRSCRSFDFKPHYRVVLEKKAEPPVEKSANDSYNGFRSDFIHMHISLTSSIRPQKPGQHRSPSSLHLTPRAFAHFWSWWSLFDGILSLPIRQGNYFPRRQTSPKFGHYLATLKYRISVPQLYVMHAYIEDSRETWADGVTPWVGVKGFIKEFQVDMHQRDEENEILINSRDQSSKAGTAVRRKRFYAAELVMKGVDLRALLATFPEPLKMNVPVNSPLQRSNYRSRTDLPSIPPSSPWFDDDDFVEVDWRSQASPIVNLISVLTCPRFMYIKRNTAENPEPGRTSKFGMERTHTCFLGSQPCELEYVSIPNLGLHFSAVSLVQIELAQNRALAMKKSLVNSESQVMSIRERDAVSNMIGLIEEYIDRIETQSSLQDNAPSLNYLMPDDAISTRESTDFDNVIQIHNPIIFLDDASRDIMIQYYYCSRARKGHEYHMATRAVKFILDQAATAVGDAINEAGDDSDGLGKTTQMAQALRRILSGEHRKASIHIDEAVDECAVNPLSGWSEGIALQKSIVGHLLKPQIVLRTVDNDEAVCIAAAVQATLQSFAILDQFNKDDPISGKIMTRSYASLSGLQMFSPVEPLHDADGYVPLEVLIDLRCESRLFDRLVPQTDASFQYDKFNRLRLRNNVTCANARPGKQTVADNDSHLQDQTDLIRIHSPRFTVGATDAHFETISHIITSLLLFSDAAHKTQTDKLETLLFTYDFTDLPSAARVVGDLQRRLRSAMEMQKMAQTYARPVTEETEVEILKLRAHIFLLSEELNFFFGAIKLAQDRSEDRTNKSAVLVHASASEISWRMLDEQRALLAKHVVQDPDFYWLSRQDGSTVNNLSIGNLSAFDGAKDAVWQEILTKYDEPANHPLVKRGVFLLANWTVLPPVGGIAIYEAFEVSLHPFRLQIHAAMGRRIMEYLFPSRKERNKEAETTEQDVEEQLEAERPLFHRMTTRAIYPHISSHANDRSSLDSQTMLKPKPNRVNALSPPPLRKLGSSRSFTDLRSTAAEERRSTSRHALGLTRMQSSDALNRTGALDHRTIPRARSRGPSRHVKKFDAAEMKTRASQKSFVLVRISSLHILLSVLKEDSFVCRDALIRTRDLQYRNQTMSFDDFVEQFIPTNMSWAGWIKMAFHQPLVPVFPVAKELISKTKLMSSKNSKPGEGGPPSRSSTPVGTKPKRKALHEAPNSGANISQEESRWKRTSNRKGEPVIAEPAIPFTTEPELIEFDSDVNSRPPSRSEGQNSRPAPRQRVLSLFTRSSSRSRLSV